MWGSSDRRACLHSPLSSPTRFAPLLFLIACTLFIFSPLVADPDLWGHVRFGQDALLAGRLVRPDPYSYLTAGRPWINHEWLTEVLYAFSYNAAGPAGLIALNSALNLAIVGLIYRRLRRAAMAAPGALLLTLGVALVLRPAVLNVRPQVFTYLMFLLLLLLVEGYTSGAAALGGHGPGQGVAAGARAGSFLGRGAGELWLPAATILLLALWVNLHGGVLAGIAILYLWGLLYLGEAIIGNRSLNAPSPGRHSGPWS